MVLAPGVDRTELAELLTESFCLLAPRTLVDRVRAVPEGGSSGSRCS